MERSDFMLYKLRYKIANHLIKKSVKLIEKGDFKDIKKGMKYCKMSVSIVPPSKELSEFGKQLREAAAEELKKLES